MESTFFGWDEDQLILAEKNMRQIYTIFVPGTFVPIIHASGDKKVLEKTLSQKIQQQTGVALNWEVTAMLDSQDNKIRGARLSALMHKNISDQVRKDTHNDETVVFGKKIHYYLCDHLGTPLALTDSDNHIAWAAKLDPWGNIEQEYNPKKNRPTHSAAGTAP